MKICRYCEIFETCPDKYRKAEKRGDRIVHYRYCSIVKKDVYGDDDACSCLIPHDYFFCDNLKQRMHITICIKSQQNRRSDCKGCYQGSQILSCRRGYRKKTTEETLTSILARRKQDGGGTC